ncbi:MAG: hypothetical protein E3J35_06805 [Methanomassiliicoccales archaeon]|nr:MAG: hypothetical protein E3J35_06805 [Methanomassiliicoccales archaeon]
MATFAFAIYIGFVSERFIHPPPPNPITGSFKSIEVSNATSATAIFGSFENNPEPTKLRIRLQNGSAWAGYSWETNADGEILRHGSGDPGMGTITYHDLEDNGEVNEGDYLLITGLGPDSTYTISLLARDGSLIDSDLFSTPSG